MEKGVGNTIVWSFAAQDCFAIGSQAFELAVEAAKGNLPTEEIYDVPGQLVMADNLDEYLEEYNFQQEQVLKYQ